MKKKNQRKILLSIVLLSSCILGMSQKVETAAVDSKGKKIEVKYRRSSLHTILIESKKFPFKDTVVAAYNNAPFPDKYNNHNIGEKSFNPEEYGNVNSDTADYKLIVDKYLNKNKIANKLVAKWFDRKDDGSFDMNLIGERGSYNASEMETLIAKKSTKGIASLSDAGEELIQNTFVVVSKLNFVNNEVVAGIVRDAAKVTASSTMSGLALTLALSAADLTYEKTKEGYSVWTTSYLYRLRWNDSIASVFYNEMWTDKGAIDPAKVAKFDNTDIFKLEFVGKEKSSSLVMFSLTEKRSEAKIVEIATVRTIDAVYAKLQKKYDVFKTKTPLYSGNPITAKIGMKEGLVGGEKFEVLEQVIDAEGHSKYEKKGEIKVDKKQIWDNRFSAGEKISKDDVVTDSKLDRTFFKGGKDYYAGMLIRQIK